MPWYGELPAELVWTGIHTVGQRIVVDCDPSVIEAYPLRVHLLVVHSRYPGGDMESATAQKDPYIVHVRERERERERGRGR